MSKMLRYSSLTKKYIMALIGVFLMIFLMVHLAINMFIMPLTENHQETFRQGVEFMTKMILYIVHERIWNKIKWGKNGKQNIGFEQAG